MMSYLLSRDSYQSFYHHLGVSRFDFVKLCMTFDLSDMLDACVKIKKDEWESSELLMYSQNYTICSRSRLMEAEYHYTRIFNKSWQSC